MDGQAPHDLTPPAQLRPPGLPAESAVETPRRHAWAWVLLGILLLGALTVVFALPSWLSPVQKEIAPAEPPEPAVNETDSVALREQAQQTLERYLRLRAKLELENAAVWGEPDWSESAQHADSGDRGFSQRRFSAARHEYGLALGKLEKIEASRPILLATALENAATALASDDAPGAIEAYEVALQIVPDHQDAVAGIAVARRRGEAIEQMKLGRSAETNRDLEAARTAYREAVKLDSGYAAAAAALQRVDSAISASRYNEAMTLALQALDAGESAAADKALAEAGQLRPGDPAVRDARQRLQAMRVRAGLGRLRRQAESRVREEDWGRAVRVYRKALGLDPSVGFARTGIGHAEERVKLHAQFDHYLDRPSRLYSAAPLANAEKLLASASEAPPSEPRLADKIARLRTLVTQARTPVRVTLRSDGETDVAVYRVARLGRLVTHELDLRPGDYTVVGSRAGYRDVRKVIRVRPGKPVPPLSIRCEEAI